MNSDWQLPPVFLYIDEIYVWKEMFGQFAIGRVALDLIDTVREKINENETRD